MLKKTLPFMVMIYAASAWSTSFQLSGNLTTYHSKEPVASCLILLEPESPTALPDTAISDNRGSYSITDVSPGVYTVSVMHDHYLALPQRIAIDGQVTADFQLAPKSHVVEGDLPRKLTKEMSPIFILADMIVNHDLVIEPGVTIYYSHSLTLGGPSITASGRADDPISFVSLNNEIVTSLTSADQKFTHCVFQNSQSLNVYSDSGNQKTTFDSCMFSINDLSIGTSGLKVRHSTIRALNTSIVADSIVLTGNNLTGKVDENSSSTQISVNIHGLISDNNFPQTNFYLQSSRDTVINNIFEYLYVEHSNSGSLCMLFNCTQLFESASSSGLIGIGKNVIMNDNGFPCDLFFNIIADPMIENRTTGKLSWQSPCYRAGFKGTNIGAWKQEQYGSRIAQRNSRANTKNSFIDGRHPMVVPVWKSSPAGSPLLSNRTGQLTKAAIFQLNGRRIASSNNRGTSFGGGVSGRSGQRLSKGVYVLEQLSH